MPLVPREWDGVSLPSPALRESGCGLHRAGLVSREVSSREAGDRSAALWCPSHPKGVLSRSSLALKSLLLP